MQTDLIYRSFPKMTEEDYRAVVERWLKLEDNEQRQAFYREELFPRSCYRIRRQAPEDPVSLLLVPVGTQAFAPILACLGTPAEKTVLFYTQESKKFALEVIETFGDSRSFHKVLIDENDTHEIVRKVQSVVDVLGQPKEVTCDVTGGTKPMTATLAGVAAINGWRQVYVRSTFVQQKGSHSEEIVELASFFEALGGWHRVVAEEFAKAGHFEQARIFLQRATEEALASAQDQVRLKRFELAQAYRGAKVDRVLRKVRGVARASRTPLPEKTLQAMKIEAREGLYYWIARCLLEEGQELAASAVLGLYLQVSCEPNEVRKGLRELAKQHRKDWHLDAWKPIDTLLGRGYTEVLNIVGGEPNAH